MIGFYDYTVILTYISLASSILGMISACYARIGWAIFFLGMSGLLDTFDGKVARTKKNRTEDQKRFGIQIDSLCDIVCFGVCPVIICWFSGMQAPWEVAILIFYCLAGLIRLAYYNVMEEKRQQETDEKRKYYQGLPITSIAVILPFLTLTTEGLLLFQTTLPLAFFTFKVVDCHLTNNTDVLFKLILGCLLLLVAARAESVHVVKEKQLIKRVTVMAKTAILCRIVFI